jgi:hypothetical protein
VGDDDCDIGRDRCQILQEQPRVLGTVVRAAACPHVEKYRRPAALRQREYLPHPLPVLRIAQADAGIAEMLLDPDHSREREASFELRHGRVPQRIGAAKADQPSRVSDDLARGPVIFVPGHSIRIGEPLPLVSEAVADRKNDSTVDAGGIQFLYERRSVALRKFYDRLKGRTDKMLVIIDQRRGRHGGNGSGAAG